MEKYHGHEQNYLESPLVLPDFTIDIAKEMGMATTTFYPGYPTPEQRLHMTREQIEDWKSRGSRTSDLPSGPYIVMDHPNYLRGVAKGTALVDDGTTDFSDHDFTPTVDPAGYRRDERGIPVRPYDELFLQKGALEGIGFYRTYGPNLTADPVVLRDHEDKLEVLLIKRRDSGIIALPGGMQDPNEQGGISTATRELFEEAGVDLKATPAEVVHQGIVWSDTRSTRHAWPETTVVLLSPDAHEAANLVPKAGDDAVGALWKEVNSETFKDMLLSHASFIKLSVLAWQKQTGLTVANNGVIKR